MNNNVRVKWPWVLLGSAVCVGLVFFVRIFMWPETITANSPDGRLTATVVWPGFIWKFISLGNTHPGLEIRDNETLEHISIDRFDASGLFGDQPEQIVWSSDGKGLVCIYMAEVVGTAFHAYRIDRKPLTGSSTGVNQPWIRSYFRKQMRSNDKEIRERAEHLDALILD